MAPTGPEPTPTAIKKRQGTIRQNRGAVNEPRPAGTIHLPRTAWGPVALPCRVVPIVGPSARP